MRLKCLDPVDAGRPKHRTRNPIFGNNVYVYRQPLFDYYGVKAGGGQKLTAQILFSIAQAGQYTPAGGAAISKSAWHTNLIGQGGILPQPDRLCVKQISGFLRNDTNVGDLQRFVSDTLGIFFMGSSAIEYWRTHFFKIPAAGGAFGFSSAITGNGIPDTHNEPSLWGPAVGNQFNIAGCEIIEAGQNFGFTLDPTLVSDASGATTLAPAADINAFVYLDGIRIRGVQ